MTINVGKYIQLDDGQTVWHEVNTPRPTLDNTTTRLLFIIEAQLFHGCTRREAVMLSDDGIDTLYDSVSTQTNHTPTN